MAHRDRFYSFLTTAACVTGVLAGEALLPGLGALAGGIGTNWASDQLRDRLFSRQGVGDGDLARVLAEALSDALAPATLIADFRQTPAFVLLLRENRGEASEAIALLKAL